MCLRQRNLVSSHLIPAALYDLCRTGPDSPIKVGGGFVIPTDRQTQDYLLCQECEDVLNRGGERWIADKLATWERAFPFYNSLTKVPPFFDEGGLAVYSAASNPEIEIEKLIHFALGLFWKASVHSWKGDTSDPRIELGRYCEKIRQWLRNESKFPEFLHLIVVVERPQKAQITVNDPYEGMRTGWRNHFFHVPGVLFMMALGRTVDEYVSAIAVNNVGNPINVSDELTAKFENLLVQSLRSSRKTQAYLRAKTKADADRKRTTT